MTGSPSIISPMATGNGAYIIHRILGNKIPNYHICGYNPYWTLFPPVLPFLCRRQGIPDIIHTTPDYAAFFYRKSVPLVLTFQNYMLDRRMRPYSSWAQKIHYATDLRLQTWLALQKAHTVTAVNHFTARLVQQDLNLSRPIKVIYNGVDVNHFAPVPSSISSRKEVRVFFPEISHAEKVRTGYYLLQDYSIKMYVCITLRGCVPGGYCHPVMLLNPSALCLLGTCRNDIGKWIFC